MAALQKHIRNSFLRALSPEDFQLFSEHLVRVDLPRRMVLIQEHRPIDNVFYPETGLASIVALTPEREIIEVGCFGHEGSSDYVLKPGEDNAPLRTFMQIAGAGWQMDAVSFANALHRSQTLMSLVMRYEVYKGVQFAYTALSHGSYNLPERLARWILTVADRAGEDFSMTHEYLAMMLAVRRSGVSEAIQRIEGERFIKTTRGAIRITDREGLTAFANGSYGVPEALYERTIGPMTLP